MLLGSRWKTIFLGEKVLKGTIYLNDGNVERRNLPKKFNYILSCIFERFTLLQVLSDRLVLTVPLQVKDRLGKMQGYTGLINPKVHIDMQQLVKCLHKETTVHDIVKARWPC